MAMYKQFICQFLHYAALLVQNAMCIDSAIDHNFSS